MDLFVDLCQLVYLLTNISTFEFCIAIDNCSNSPPYQGRVLTDGELQSHGCDKCLGRERNPSSTAWCLFKTWTCPLPLTPVTSVNQMMAKWNQLPLKINQPSNPQIKARAIMENSPLWNLRIIGQESSHSSTMKSQNFSVTLGGSWSIIWRLAFLFSGAVLIEESVMSYRETD